MPLWGLPGGSVVGILLQVQGTQVQSLVPEDSTGPGAAKPTSCKYGACEPQLMKTLCPRALGSQLLSLWAQLLKPCTRAHAPQQEKSLQ